MARTVAFKGAITELMLPDYVSNSFKNILLLNKYSLTTTVNYKKII